MSLAVSQTFIARVVADAVVKWDARTTDVPLLLGCGTILLRRLAKVSAADHTALATMMTRGECVWAGIVYSEVEGSETTGWVESFHVSELDRLVARLLDLQRVFGGDGIGSGEVVG